VNQAKSKAQITYAPRLHATLEGELNTLGTVYAYILQKHRERQRTARPSGPDGEPRDAFEEVDGYTGSICACEISSIQLPGKKQEVEQIASGKENHK